MQRRRRLARRPARQVPRVVLDAVAEAHLLEHLQVVQGALLQALALDELADALQLRSRSPSSSRMLR
jgi:transcriptional regulator GlxA family with amidase domain